MKKESLPRYVVNLEELVDALIPFNSDNKTNFGNKGMQRCCGFRFDNKTTRHSFKVEETIFLTSIDMACTGDSWSNGDSISIKIKSKKSAKDIELFKNVYLKDFLEHKEMSCYYPLKKDDEMVILLHLEKESVNEVWVDVNYILAEEK